MPYTANDQSQQIILIFSKKKNRAHKQIDVKILFAQVMPGPSEREQEQFKCLYLLVETAVAVRQREKEQEDAILPL